MSPEESNAVGTVLKEGFWWGRLLLGPSVKSVGDNLGRATDHFFEKLDQNRFKGAALIDSKILDGNVKLKPVEEINLKVLGPLIEGISLESDDDLREMWANLFVNYVDSAKNLTITVYPEILKQLSTAEADILESMINDDQYSIATDEKTQLERPVGYEELANLVRLGLIEPHRTIGYVNDPTITGNQRPMERNIENDLYFLTQFGHHFLEACSTEPLDH